MFVFDFWILRILGILWTRFSRIFGVFRAPWVAWVRQGVACVVGVVGAVVVAVGAGWCVVGLLLVRWLDAGALVCRWPVGLVLCWG